MHIDICPVCYNYIATGINPDGTLSHKCIDENCSYNREEEENDNTITGRLGDTKR